MGSSRRRPTRLVVFVATAAAATSLVSAFAAGPGPAPVAARAGSDANQTAASGGTPPQSAPTSGAGRGFVLPLTPGSIALLLLGGALAIGPVQRVGAAAGAVVPAAV